jgi:replicative DNA helicase
MSLETGPFAETADYERKVLAQMLAAPQFCEVAGNALSGEDFSTKINQYYFSKLSEAEIHLTPTTLKEEILKDARAKLIKKDDVSQYTESFRVVSQAPVPAEVDYINKHMINFIRRQACVRAVLDSPGLLEQGEFSEVERRIVEAANAGADIMSMGLDYFSGYQSRIANRVHREKERKLATGIPELDELTYGGLKTKQLGLTVGGTGRGKSLFLQWLARVAVLLGKKVVYYTFELSDEDMADRFDSMFAHIKPSGLQDHSSQALRELSKYHKRFGSSLFIKEYPEDEVTVPELKAHLMQLTAQGFMPDLVIVDYVDLIKPHRTYNDINQEQATVIKALRGLAKSLNTRVWTACQLNRSGLSMETPDEGSIAGGISRLFTCDLALFMAQTLEEREDEIMRLIISKNRNGRAGKTIKLDTEYDFLTFFKAPAEKDDDDDGGKSGTDANPQGDDVQDEEGEMLVLS